MSDRTSADNWTPPVEPHDPLYETVFGKVTLLHKRIRWLGKCYPVPPMFSTVLVVRKTSTPLFSTDLLVLPDPSRAIFRSCPVCR